MSTLAKLLILPALVVAFSVGVALAASGVGGSSTPAAQVAPATSTDDTTTLDTTTVDTTTTTTEDNGREPGEDVRGPCDEAENANDPRCTGVGGDRDDSSGPGNVDDRGHGDDDNSGPGNADDRDDNSGPGNGDEDDDDRSGHGDGDDDSSGHGWDDDR
jgi:hypothetical protein